MVEAGGPDGEALLPHGVRLILAYDGTDFHGWQLQPGVRTVQGVLEDAIARAGFACRRMRGASRTDAGVHAEAQVVSFTTDREIPPKGWALRLNALLPSDVAVQAAAPCVPGYDPRFDSLGKTYRYLLHCGYVRDPLRARRYWFVLPNLSRRDVQARTDDVATWLDLEAMARAAERLLGTHDFRAFRAANDPRENTIRTMRAIRLVPGYLGAKDALAIEVEGDAFMKNMVRIMVGTLLDVGRRHTTPDEVTAMLEPGRGRRDTGPTAPAHGLTLVRIELGRLALIEAGRARSEAAAARIAVARARAARNPWWMRRSVALFAFLLLLAPLSALAQAGGDATPPPAPSPADAPAPATEPGGAGVAPEGEAPPADAPAPRAPTPKVAVVVVGDPDPALVAAAGQVRDALSADATMLLPADPALNDALFGGAAPAVDDGLGEIRALRRRLGLGAQGDRDALESMGRLAGAVAVVVVKRAPEPRLEVFDVGRHAFFADGFDLAGADGPAIAGFVLPRARAALAHAADAPAAAPAQTPAQAAEAAVAEEEAPAEAEAEERPGFFRRNIAYFAAGALVLGAGIFLLVDRLKDDPAPIIRIRPGGE